MCSCMCNVHTTYTIWYVPNQWWKWVQLYPNMCLRNGTQMVSQFFYSIKFNGQQKRVTLQLLFVLAWTVKPSSNQKHQEIITMMADSILPMLFEVLQLTIDSLNKQTFGFMHVINNLNELLTQHLCTRSKSQIMTVYHYAFRRIAVGMKNEGNTDVPKSIFTPVVCKIWNCSSETRR